MNLSVWSTPVVQWLLMLPTWLALLGGLVVSLVFWNRARVPAALTLLALLLLAISTGLHPAVNNWLVRSKDVHHWTTVQLGYRILAARGVFGLLNAAGYALLLGAAFTGRHATGSVYPPLPTDPRYL